MIVHITTADFNRESICNEKLKYAENVRDGIIQDNAFLPVIYGASIEEDWQSPEVWARANPNLGVSVDAVELAEEARKAFASPRAAATFYARSKRRNMRARGTLTRPTGHQERRKRSDNHSIMDSRSYTSFGSGQAVFRYTHSCCGRADGRHKTLFQLPSREEA